MKELLEAITRVEVAIDGHASICRPKADEDGIGAVEIAFNHHGWTVKSPIKRRDARKNSRWTSAHEFAETLADAVDKFIENLDRWAEVLR